MNAISSILRAQENFAKAVEYLQSILKLDGNNGDVWGSLGECDLFQRCAINCCSITILTCDRTLLFNDG